MIWLTIFFDNRAETEAYTIRASRLILKHLLQGSNSQNPTLAPLSLRILDLCSGTGCIPLLLHQLLSPHVSNLEIVGIDISKRAISLARKNLEHNIHLGLLPKRARSEIRFLQGNILEHRTQPQSLENALQSTKREDNCLEISGDGGSWDVLISNPPYISPTQFGNGTTARSVRLYEPKLALVPPIPTTGGSGEPRAGMREPDRVSNINSQPRLTVQADTFYPRLISLSSLLNTRLSIFECGDPQQAQRVVDLASTYRPTEELKPKLEDRKYKLKQDFKVEVWRCNDEFGLDDRCNGPAEGCSIEDDQGARAVILKRKPF
jgi:hypothetical protein